LHHQDSSFLFHWGPTHDFCFDFLLPFLASWLKKTHFLASKNLWVLIYCRLSDQRFRSPNPFLFFV
jgi:hypothetical protein